MLALRADDGRAQEPATVVDVYELITSGESRPMVVVDFGDGERRWLTALPPDVAPFPSDEATTPEPDAEPAHEVEVA